MEFLYKFHMPVPGKCDYWFASHMIRVNSDRDLLYLHSNPHPYVIKWAKVGIVVG